jgi:signal transduction histidine kinase
MNITFISQIVASLIVISFAIFVSIKNRKNIYFTIFGTAIFTWLFASSLAYIAQLKIQALFWFKISYIGVVFIPITFYSFVSNFLGKKQNIINFLNYLIGLVFICLLYFSDYFIKDLYEYSWGFYPKASLITHPLFLLFFNGLFTISIVSIVLKLRDPNNKLSSIYKNRLKYIFLGSVFGILGVMDFLPNYGINIYPFGFIFMIIIPTIISYAILRYHLMDISIVFKRTAAYSLSAGLLTAFFAILVITATNLLSAFTNVSSLKISIVAAFVITILFNPLRNKIQILIDRMFYKKSFDYYETVRQVSSNLASMFDTEKIYKFICDVIYDAMGLQNIYLLVGLPGGAFDIVHHTSSKKDRHVIGRPGSEKPEEMKMNKFSGILKFFRVSDSILIKDELTNYEGSLGQEAIDRIKKELEIFHGEGVVPVFIDKKLSLLLILGQKQSGDMFTNEDMDLLKTISNQTAVALKNVRLYQEKVNSEKLASLGMMSGTFAHEIRNPLTSLKTFAQLMPEKYNDPEFRDTFSRIVIGDIQKIDGLISDLLDFSTERKSTRMNNFNLIELVDGVVDYVEGKLEFERSKITIEKNYNEKEINMMGDTEKLRQALGNIVLNGCQAMHGEGVLQIDIKPNGKNIDITVEDMGEGINPEDLPKIFDPFVTTKKMGIGLGLAISKRIIEDYNGKIYVKSHLAQRTTFTISLPVQNQ